MTKINAEKSCSKFCEFAIIFDDTTKPILYAEFALLKRIVIEHDFVS